METEVAIDVSGEISTQKRMTVHSDGLLSWLNEFGSVIACLTPELSRLGRISGQVRLE